MGRKSKKSIILEANPANASFLEIFKKEN